MFRDERKRIQVRRENGTEVGPELSYGCRVIDGVDPVGNELSGRKEDVCQRKNADSCSCRMNMN